MAQLITPGLIGDPPKVIEDKTRALPANQGKNEDVMWGLIDTEVTSAASASKLINNERYDTGGANTVSNKHGKK